MKQSLFAVVVVCLAILALPAVAANYERKSTGTRWLEGAGGLTIKVLVEGSVLGASEVFDLEPGSVGVAVRATRWRTRCRETSPRRRS
ncbi:MAG: hypothetical protein VYE73_15615 [Acidobacteriota bacterium]|nr:hypothetical protein [Acidobacteriota bacterium]